ncbi:MAG: arginase family protein [Sphingomonas sp.]|uniref:arginase family protein n=1 Tax=Sphingomonas sp. TaxID=28214 RepID=UPI001827F22A|nr:arginase family protein [Sphingomonas sp.]MBA3666932.1 arginase family protein [Sphingomonas sp.]
MQPHPQAFDLVLAYPQWQGSARYENLLRGARAVEQVCARFGPVASVQLSDDDSDAYGVKRWGAIFDQFCSAQEIMGTHRPKRVLTAGGDCAVDIAVIDYLNGLYPSLNVIWIDTHLDTNTPETSPSGSFHGMPVSAIMGQAPGPIRSRLRSPVSPTQFRYFGIRIGDEGEWQFQRAHDLKTLDPDMRVEGPVHIHFDLDVLDPAEFPYLAYGVPGGLPVEDAISLVHRIARESDVVGFTVTEFAPANDQDAQEGSKVIERLCDAVVGR